MSTASQLAIWTAIHASKTAGDATASSGPLPMWAKIVLLGLLGLTGVALIVTMIMAIFDK